MTDIRSQILSEVEESMGSGYAATVADAMEKCPTLKLAISEVGKYPIQPLSNHRFESNPIIEWLCAEVSSMNDIAVYCCENNVDHKYQEQVAQLVGYSLSGYGDLSYVSDESYYRAQDLIKE